VKRHDLVVGPWGARFVGHCFPCAVGRGGIGEKRAEGDGVTPAGVHRIEAVHGRMESVWKRYGNRMATRHIACGPIRPFDLWSDDPADPCYNRLVRAPHGFSHERMQRADGMYDLVAVLDWNRDPVVPGRGSAIFLHVWRKPRHPTAGCIAFARDDLAWILAHWQRDSRVVARAG
jgi:L,D-peptidoglycan transpeptidase YkuD (ErfK/YbiS/YcfS/YnhG family)